MKFKEHELVWNDSNVSRLWDYYSKSPPYNQMYFSKLQGDKLIKLLKSQVDIKKGSKIVDFGGGQGFMYEHCENNLKSFEYTNLDFSMDSVSKSVLRLKDRPHFNQSMFIEKLPVAIKDSSVDIVFLIEVIEHLNPEHLSGTLQEIKRILKPGGILLLTTPNDEDLGLSNNFCPNCGAVYHKWQHVSSFNASSILNVLETYNFDSISLLERNLPTVSRFYLKLLLKFYNFFRSGKRDNLISISSKKLTTDKC